jgi:DNA ligase-4
MVARWAEADPAKDAYPLLRLLLPELDKERVTYGMKEKNIGRYYLKALAVGEDTEDGRRVGNYRNAQYNRRNAGDFAAVVADVLRRRQTPVARPLTIAQVGAARAREGAGGRRACRR